ncbi:unnamed protein product [Nezara viridula]|uniref:Uncharacterized protein n=1 Tax=Nezara viridula TaxID=85310 RepID=A0A9P0H4U3_NEZVI|nr:unnamed protein product [Nezara viridula]
MKKRTNGSELRLTFQILWKSVHQEVDLDQIWEREEERTPSDRLVQGDEEDLWGCSLEEISIGEERVETDGTGSLPAKCVTPIALLIASTAEGEANIKSTNFLAHSTKVLW